jgi:hypothetical protein
MKLRYTPKTAKTLPHLYKLPTIHDLGTCPVGGLYKRGSVFCVFGVLW